MVTLLSGSIANKYFVIGKFNEMFVAPDEDIKLPIEASLFFHFNNSLHKNTCLYFSSRSLG